MKRLLLVLCLAGCAQQPQQPTEAQLAVISYYADICKRQGVSDEAMKGCIWATYQRDVNAGVYGRSVGFGDALQGMGSVYSSGAQQPRQQQCSTRPDYAGGWVTSCY